MKRLLLVVVTGLVLSCAPLKNSPFSEETQSSATNLNAHFLGAIKNSSLFSKNAPPIVFGVFSDSHQNYMALEDWVRDANTMDFDFVVSLGDFTNQGMNFEYDAYLSLISPLKAPLITVLGNHDSVGRGKLIYRRVFGPYSFTYEMKGYKFVVFNNNRLDFIDEGIDWNWLEKEVRGSSVPVVIFMHVDPDNQEYFTDENRAQFWNIVRGLPVRLIMNGHKHVYQTETKDGILRHQVERLERGRWSRVTLAANSITVEKCTRRDCSHEVQHIFDTDSQPLE